MLGDLLLVMLGELDPLEVPAESSSLAGGVKTPEEGVKTTDSVVVFEFADEVVARARRLAAESGQSEHVTLSHYRQAAQIAARALQAAILGGGPFIDDHKVA